MGGGALAQGWPAEPSAYGSPAGPAAPAAGARPGQPQRVRVQNPGLIEMTVRRLPDAVEVVISGVGAMPQLLQSNQGSSWAGRLLVATPGTLRRGPQRLSLPEAGLQMISLEGAGNRFALTVTPTPGFPLGRPVVSADGSNLIISFAAAPQSGQQSYSRNLSLPGRIPQAELVPPLQPRAVAPPLGDMAVGSMVLRNSGFVDVSGPPVTMTLSNAPARAVLMKLARIGGYGFVYVQDRGSGQGEGEGGDSGKKAASTAQELVSISFRNESYSRALNSTLLAAGLQGKLEGNTLLAGPNVLGKSFGSQLSKVYRLNQVAANSAADYLASLGAKVTKTNTITTSVTQGVNQTQAVANSTSSATTQTSSTTQVEAYGATTGPLVGLQATTDSRLSTITLVGSPSLVAVAEQYLKQLDLRQRQVALSVKILDVSLGNNSTVDNSFAFRSGNSFIVNQQGQLVANFGSLKPPSSPEGGLPGLYDGVNGTPTVGTGAYRLPGGSTQLFLTPELASPIPGPGGKAPFYDPRYPARPPFGSYANPGQPGVTKFTPGEPSVPATIQSIIVDPTTGQQTYTYSTPTIGTPDELTFANPTAFQYPNNQFFDFVRATIESSSTKVLASPTLILSENSEELVSGTGPNALAGLSSQSSSGSSGSSGSTGSSSSSSGSENNATIGRSKANEAFVTVGEQEIVSYQVQAGQNGAPNTCQPVLGISGLTFGARVSKIDDNGFVTFTMSPSISATVGSEIIPGCGRIKTLAVRRLDTGSARVRDGQTLILTGVLSDRDSEIVQKWPILGDIPFIGQFFRNSGGTRSKRELVIMVTPRIIDDSQGGSWGYGYQPGTRDGRRFLGGSGSAPSF
jgi:type IV pilus assembly protein PilQ